MNTNQFAFIRVHSRLKTILPSQEGFGAFSYGHSQLTSIINYIRGQERHHARRSFGEE